METYYNPEDLAKFSPDGVGEGAPELWDLYMAYYGKVFAEGELTAREKALIALAVAAAVQCPYCIDSYTNTCMEMVDRLRDTSQSHERCSVVEVMGRQAGYLALHAGIACGATSIIVPEVPINLERDIIPKMRRTQLSGKKHYIIVVAEGVGGVANIAQQIQDLTGIESRATILGHVQRGGSPSVRDRVVASEMGHHAVELLSQGIGNRVVAMQKSAIVDFDINEALEMVKPFDEELYRVANDISI